ncbi:hypothetical protein [Olleya sp. YS]|uniref:hypothetical protein n=1 Tax=Olleya sp. YS TaxID=3028318 RepID=UPI00243429BA|nr:hypothetical protein [Olleya sp. YS]WGD34447.1 hypothetical protein Ollyesu_11730 [Olleya sp. YS]
MIKELKFCTLLFSDNYVISTINEGVIFGKVESRLQSSEILDVFNDKPFVYISNRINSYSVDPTIYIESSQICNLSGFAAVIGEFSNRNVEVERLFLNKPFESFSNLEDAKIWANNILSKVV